MRFVAENTFVDGKSLSEIYPKIEDFLTQYRAASDNLDEMISFDAFRTTPTNLRKLGGYIDLEGNYVPNQAMVDAQEEAEAAAEAAALVGGYFDDEGNYHPNQAMVDAQEEAEAEAEAALVSGWLDAEGNYHPNEVMVDT